MTKIMVAFMGTNDAGYSINGHHVMAMDGPWRTEAGLRVVSAHIQKALDLPRVPSILNVIELDDPAEVIEAAAERAYAEDPTPGLAWKHVDPSTKDVWCRIAKAVLNK